MTHARGTNSRAMVSTLACLSALGFKPCELSDVYRLKRPYAELSATYGLFVPGGSRLRIDGWIRSASTLKAVGRYVPIAFLSFDECLAEIAERIVVDKDFLNGILQGNDEDLFLHFMKYGISIYLDLLFERKLSGWVIEQSLSDEGKTAMLKWRS